MSAAEMPTPEQEARMWTADDVARFLACSVSWVRKASSAGRMPCVRLGGMVRYDPDAIRAWSRGERGGKVITLPRR